MLLTITTTHTPATDLGYLLFKNPARHHVKELSFGTAHLFYPEATAARCSVAVLAEKQFEEILTMDVSCRSLEKTKERLHFDRLPPKQQERVQLLQGSLMYRDGRLAGYDAAAVVEVIEHLDAPRLAAFERVLFEFAAPGHGGAHHPEWRVQCNLGVLARRQTAP